MARNKFDVDENLETPFDIRHFKRSLKYVKKHTLSMLTAVFLSAISILLSLCTPIIMRYALDVSVPNKNIAELIQLAALLAGAILLSIMFAKIRMKIMARVGQDIIYEIRHDLFEHLQKLPFSYYDDRPHGKILVRIVQYVNNISDMLSNGIINFILEIFNLVFITIFMFLTDVKLAFVVVAGLPILFCIFFLIEPKQRKAWQDVSNKNSNLNAYLQESISGMRVTQIFTREKKNAEIFDTLSVKSKNSFIKAILISNFVWVSVDNIAQLITGMLYVTGILWSIPMVSFGVIYAMGDYSWRFWQPINNLSQIYNDFLNTIAYLERIFETMDEEVVVDNAPDAYEMPEIKGEVEFKNVVFGYDPNKIILNDVSFKIKPGESIALVGPTGAGKTTIVNLISRFYNLNAGAVLIDGHDISKATLKSLRSQMGIMLQDSFIFSGSIEENVCYGKLDADLHTIEQACKVVHADEFVNAMKHKFKTEVKERGGRLSQGQKQLISFARTIISDPKILILDEATSSIDTKTEQYVQEGINHLLKGRTSFVIAHRLSTIKNCDKIMVISNQNISEFGSHDELMQLKGEYYNLYTTQMSAV